MTLFGNRVFADDQIKMRSLGRSIIQYDWCPYKMWKFGCTDRYVQKEDDVKTQVESHLQGEEILRVAQAGGEAWDRLSLTALRRQQPC